MLINRYVPFFIEQWVNVDEFIGFDTGQVTKEKVHHLQQHALPELAGFGMVIEIGKKP